MLGVVALSIRAGGGVVVIVIIIEASVVVVGVSCRSVVLVISLAGCIRSVIVSKSVSVVEENSSFDWVVDSVMRVVKVGGGCLVVCCSYDSVVVDAVEDVG